MRLSPLVVAAVCSVATGAEEGAQSTSRLGGSAAPQVLEAVAGLAVVLVVIFALAWAVRRFAHLPTASKGLIRVLGGVALGSRERAVIVAVGSTRLLLGVAPGQVRMLHVLPEEPSHGGSFATELAAEQKRNPQ